jgi:hypothetical protein
MVFFVSFGEVFPKIAMRETRGLIIREDPIIPAGIYTFFELYCPDPNCDCRMVRLSVLNENDVSHAEISYGWHNKQYYKGPFNDFEDNGLPGPSCSYGAPQGPFAPIFLQRFKDFFLPDARYVYRLKHHYALIKMEAKKTDLKKLIIKLSDRKISLLK